MKKLLAALLAVMLVVAAVLMVACDNKPKSEVQKIIEEAQNMSMEDLAKKAIEESKGKKFYGVGNSSRGKSALPLFIDYLKTIDSSYTLDFDWQQPKNNKIFDQLTADSKKAQGTFAMTLIQDGNQIESKMVQTGILDTFIPKGWAEANKTSAKDYKGYLALQTLNKVFMYNCVDSTKTYTNIWDFVRDGEHGLYMDIDSEIVGKNFLYMLTKPEYAAALKESYSKVTGAEKTRIDKVISELEQDAKDLGLDENGKYALAWIKLWVNSYNAQSDDGPICNTLVKDSAKDAFGLLVYSKLRSVDEHRTAWENDKGETQEPVSKNNIKVAAYEDNYTGIGGYGYCHYLFVTDNSPLPWTACAFIAYMTETVDGFSAWGKDIGGYSSNPTLAAANEAKYNHSVGGMKKGADGKPTTEVEFKALNDKGFDWWEERLVIEDPEYCASVAFSVGSWIEMLDKWNNKK